MILKNLLKNNLQGFYFFYSILGYRVFFVIIVSVLVGLLDALGLTMFLPLLQLVSGSGKVNASGLGNLDFVIKAITDMGFVLDLKTTLFFLSLFFVLKGALSFLGNKYQVNIRQMFLRKLRLSLLDDFNSIRFEEFMKWDIGRIQNSFTTETERITVAFFNYFKAMNLVVNVVVYSLFAIYTDPGFAMLVILVASVSQLVYFQLYKLNRKASRNLTNGNSVFHGMISQYISNFKYLKATGRQVNYGEKLKETINSIEEENRKMGYYNAIFSSTREPMLLIVISTVIFIQSQVFHAELGPIIMSLMFFYRALTAMSSLQAIWNLYIRYSGSIENITDFIKQLKAYKIKKEGGEQLKELTNSITLKDVSFAYDEKLALSGINLCIHKNETVAIVGGSGSGKTTLVNLISGLILSFTGDYKIDGKDFRDIKISSLKDKIGYISQEPVIFNGTIFENITFWAEKTPENLSKFNEVIQRTSLNSFLETLEFGEDTSLGANGFNLSGGQKQRISIARELFRDIEILILDEATSALDSETERVVHSSIVGLKGTLTIIMIAHRLSTVKHADTILVMHHGKITNSGSYEQLLRDDQKFQSMVQLQTL